MTKDEAYEFMIESKLINKLYDGILEKIKEDKELFGEDGDVITSKDVKIFLKKHSEYETKYVAIRMTRKLEKLLKATGQDLDTSNATIIEMDEQNKICIRKKKKDNPKKDDE